MKESYVGEFEVHSTPKIIREFISTPSGLSRWFADNVDVDREKNFIIHYDGMVRKAKKTISNFKKSITYEFIEGEEDNPYVIFTLEVSNLTKSVYITVEEYCDDYDSYEEFQEIWVRLFKRLKQIIGG